MIFGSFFIFLAFISFLNVIKNGVRGWIQVSCLYFLATFDATILFKFGQTFGFFEFALLILLFKCLLSGLKVGKLSNKENLVLYFLVICFASILIAQIRLALNFISTDFGSEEMILGSVMSNGKLIFYTFCLFFISRKYRVDKLDFIKGVALGSIPSAMAALLQFLPLGFMLIHNNPSFGEKFSIEIFDGQRIVGLTNEASFYAYQLAFSIAMLVVAVMRDYIKGKIIIFTLFLLYGFTVILSISRTGYVLIPIICLIIYLNELHISGRLKLRKLFLPTILVLATLVTISNISLQGFNLMERLISSFDTNSDFSTIERYDSINSLINLGLDRALFFGVGIYNYMFYIQPYMSDFLSNLYGDGRYMPSFSFIFQLFVDLGGILFLFTIFLIIRFLQNSEDIDWYWFLIAFLYALTYQVTNFSYTYFIFLINPAVINFKNVKSKK